jgi:hypothetical protein
MKLKNSIKYSFILILLLSGCSPVTYMVKARFETIDLKTDSLRLHFNFKNEIDTTSFLVDKIDVFIDRKYYCTISCPSGIAEYTFPEIPEGFVLKYAENADTTIGFVKSKYYSFYFQGSEEFIAGGWQYCPQFSEPNHRWLFDSLGNYLDLVRIQYQTWLGRDVIYLDFKDTIDITHSKILIKDTNGGEIFYNYTYDDESPTLLALELNHDLGANEEFILQIPSNIMKLKSDTLLTFRWQANDGDLVRLGGSKLQKLRY